MEKYDPEVLKGEARLNREKTNWVLNSHLWYKNALGNQICDWCGIQVLSGQGVNAEWPGLCLQNPFIRKLRVNWTKGTSS